MASIRRWRSWAAVAATLLLALVWAAAPAGAQTNGTISASPSTVPQGGTVTFSGVVNPTICPAGDAVTITSITAFFPRAGFGPDARRNSTGAFSVTYTVPTSTPPGTYTIGMRCGGGNVGVVTSVRVTSQVSTVPSGAPQAGLGGGASTGGPSAGWLAAASTLLTSAVAALLWRRRAVTVRR